MMNRRIDPWLLLIVATLISFGLVMVYSASAMVSADWTGDETQYVKRQLIAIVAGGVMCIGSAITPMRSFRIYRYRFYSACLVGLMLCYVPGIGHTVKGASRWVGFGAFHVQPSEFAKIAMLIVLADYLHRWRSRIEDPRVILKSLIIPLIPMLLIIREPDFGSTAIIGGLAAMMLFIAGVKMRHIVITSVVGLAIGFWVMISESYRVRRLTSFFDPWEDAQGDGFHTIQSWLAMHSGGLWGQGLGNSIAKLHFLPEPWTDYIAAVIAEELGFVRLILVIVFYGIFVWRGMYIARRARDAFSTYLAATITGMVGFEVFFNLGVVMGILPPKGLVLPFLSYGATAMMSHLWAVGILLSIAAEADDTPIEKGWHRHNQAATPYRDAPLDVAGK
ncbi:MAG: putative lipid II flippase FtsW [Myxococcota bacterium]|nr:putative lipid II flippase FtsW [Myxococcota bacterium]